MSAQYFKWRWYLNKYRIYLFMINITFWSLLCTFKNKIQVQVRKYLNLVRLYLVYSMMDYNPQAKVIVILKSSADANVSIEKGNFYFSTLKSIAV